ncbi:hypothetical protein [Massilia sp. SYSU DXS3249]
MKTLAVFLAGLVSGALLFATFADTRTGNKKTKVHILKAPLVLVGDRPTTKLHLLPAGTILYVDQSFPEGFTRYRIYVNVDRMPLELKDLEDPAEVAPLEARPLPETD